jgi:hypothetical protein
MQFIFTEHESKSKLQMLYSFIPNNVSIFPKHNHCIINKLWEFHKDIPLLWVYIQILPIVPTDFYGSFL